MHFLGLDSSEPRRAIKPRSREPITSRGQRGEDDGGVEENVVTELLEERRSVRYPITRKPFPPSICSCIATELFSSSTRNASRLSEEREQDLDASYRVDGTVDGVGNNGLHVLWDRQGLVSEESRLTCSMSACGEWTKMEEFSLGDDSRHSWASVALAL
ncbi:hypothetical protein EYF80_035715 [Liparis tanakae]|uniref:Uncharacterized protein n=1 Tax=Liparis tanakae TaxID=230148 RepID=A0A4Z2GMS9_9TELE|nr:hypothetical protein EYF80_035715 [Liparis tanakae]